MSLFPGELVLQGTSSAQLHGAALVMDSLRASRAALMSIMGASSTSAPSMLVAAALYSSGRLQDAASQLGDVAPTRPERGEELEAYYQWLYLRALVALAAAHVDKAIELSKEMSSAALHAHSHRWAGVAALIAGTAETDRGHLDYAFDLIERARAILVVHGRVADMARVHYQAGLNRLLAGESRRGQLELEASLTLARSVGEPLIESGALSRLGHSDLQAGRYESARARLAAASDILAGIGNDQRLAQVAFSMAALSFTMGDVPAGFRELRRAESLYYGNSSGLARARYQQVWGWGNLLNGDFRSALDGLTSARETFSKLGAQRDEALTCEFLGDLEAMLGNNSAALEYYEQGLSLGSMASSTSDVVAECLRKAAEVHVAMGAYAKAFKCLWTLRQVMRVYSDDRERAAIRRVRGIAAVRRGRTAYGLNLLFRSLALFRALPAKREARDTERLISEIMRNLESRSDTIVAEGRRPQSGAVEPRKSRSLEAGSEEPVAHLRDGLVSRDPRVARAHSLALRAAPSRLPVLILGETGSGKELLAAAVHRHSGRTGPFLTINCAALPPDILDGELFGSARGAFTGALRDRAGLIEAASGGTLFLDEVGEMSPAVQGRLLRAIELGEVRRLGENRTRKVDTRFVSATHRDLEKMVQTGEFRADLFFRLRGIVVTVPPLRERLGDVDLLTDHFLRANAKGASLTLSPEARQRLVSHAWPGNVRELKSVLERVIELSPEGATIHAEDLGLEPIRVAGSLAEHLEEEERRRVIATLESLHWNRSRAARALNMKRTTFLSKLKRLGITGPLRH